MYSLGNSFRTKVDKRKNIPIVFSTKLTLNERFTIARPRCLLVYNRWLIDAAKKVNAKERVAFSNQRSKDINERFTRYKYKQFLKSENENSESLERELLSLSKKRRTVTPPLQEIKKRKLTEHSREKRVKNLDNALPVNSNIEVASRSFSYSKVCDQGSDKRKSNSMSFSDKKQTLPYKSYISTEIKNIPDSERNSNVERNIGNRVDPKGRKIRSVVSSPFHYYGSNIQNTRMSLYSWKRHSLTKEKLDEEIDRYMAEIRYKPSETEVENVDSFVEEYMMEAEKYMQENEIHLG